MRAFVLLLLLLPRAAAAEDVVAVFEIEAKGLRLKADVLDRLTNYLATELASAPGFQVVPRDTIKAQVAAAKKESFKACYDQACQIEIGKELAAQKSLSSQILKLGANCVVTLSLIDLRKSATDRAATAEGRCTEEGLAASIRTAVGKLGPAVVSPPPASRCEILLGEGCPTEPERKKTFDDPHDNAANDRVRCLKRAQEWFSYCGGPGPVAARFYEAGSVAAEETFSPPTRCEVTIGLGEERCLGNPAIGHVINDDWEGSASNLERCKRRPLEFVNYCGVGSAVARYYSGGKLVAEEKAAPKSHCQITLGPENCPGRPELTRIFNDDWESAGSNLSRCLRRAGEYHQYCASKSEVISRYYSDGKLVQEQRAAPKSRCEISIAEGCPGNSSLNRLFNDIHESSDQSEDRCRRRALEYFYYCGTSGAVIARYFDGATLVREERANPASRCEITLGVERCPANPGLNRVFNDDWEGAGSDAARCMKRAPDYFHYCAASEGVSARYYSGGSLVKQADSKPATRCEIRLPPGGCTLHPGGGVHFNDDWEGAGSNQARCLQRAVEWDQYCGIKGSTARFLPTKR